MAELSSIDDIDRNMQELLEKSGIHSIDQLSNADPNELLSRVKENEDP